MTENREKPKTKRVSTDAERNAGRANLLAFRAKVGGKTRLDHGVRSLITTGEMPPVPGADEVEREVEAVIAGIVSDLGGADEITNAQKAILAGLRVSLRVQGLAELHVRRVGVANAKTGKPTALLSVLATFINSARLSCAMLGLDRKPKSMATLEAKLRDLADQDEVEAGTESDESEKD
jgi:hypothetical protein